MQLLSINQLISDIPKLDLKLTKEVVYCGHNYEYDNENMFMKIEFKTDDEGNSLSESNYIFVWLNRETNQIAFTDNEPFQNLAPQARKQRQWSGADTEWIRYNYESLTWQHHYVMPEFNIDLRREADGLTRGPRFLQWLVNQLHLSKNQFFTYLQTHAFESEDETDVFTIPYTGDGKLTRQVTDLFVISNYQSVLKDTILSDLKYLGSYSHNDKPWNLQYLPLVIDQFNQSELVEALRQLSPGNYDNLLNNVLPDAYMHNNTDELNDYLYHSLYNAIFKRSIKMMQQRLQVIAEHQPIVLDTRLAQLLYQVAPNLNDQTVNLQAIIPMDDIMKGVEAK